MLKKEKTFKVIIKLGACIYNTECDDLSGSIMLACMIYTLIKGLTACLAL